MREYKLELTDEELDLLKSSVYNTEQDSMESAIGSATLTLFKGTSESDLNDTAMRELKNAAIAKQVYAKLSKAKWEAMKNEC